MPRLLPEDEMRIIGYAYDAAVHCPGCTFDRFAICEQHNDIGCPECEDDGDIPGPIYDEQEFEEFDRPPHCADCGRRLKGRVA